MPKFNATLWPRLLWLSTVCMQPSSQIFRHTDITSDVTKAHAFGSCEWNIPICWSMEVCISSSLLIKTIKLLRDCWKVWWWYLETRQQKAGIFRFYQKHYIIAKNACWGSPKGALSLVDIGLKCFKVHTLMMIVVSWDNPENKKRVLENVVSSQDPP